MPGSIIGGMPTDSNVWMKDVCILGSIARGLLAETIVVGRMLGYLEAL